MPHLKFAELLRDVEGAAVLPASSHPGGVPRVRDGVVVVVLD